MSKVLRLSWLVLPLIWLCQSCYENQEGCLDPLAVNYQLDADRDCGGCCEYPELLIRPLHRLALVDDTINLDFDTFYLDALSQPYRIESVQFYLSQIQPITVFGQRVPITDSVRLQVLPDGDQVSFIDDFLLINADVSRSLSVGSWPANGTFDQVSLLFGLTEEASRVNPASVPDSHPLDLAVSDTYQNDDQVYAVARISLFRDTISSDTIPLVLFLDATSASTQIQLPLPFAYTTLPGFNTRLNLQIDYNALFDGINIMSDTSVLQQKIITNLPNVFSVTNLIVESG